MDELYWLNRAHAFANAKTGCLKVGVGSAIVSQNGRLLSLGTNISIPDCRVVGCLRVQLYGNDDKTHRGPTDCHAVHSEIHALVKNKYSNEGATIYITRYPCEGCARAIVASGIKRVFYGRTQEITDLTKQIFDYGGVEVNWIKEWVAEDKYE